MGSPQTFNETEMEDPYSPHDYARGYNVEVSSNGSTWTTVASCTGISTPEVVSFSTADGTIRPGCPDRIDSYYWWSIDEFNAVHQRHASDDHIDDGPADYHDNGAAPLRPRLRQASPTSCAGSRTGPPTRYRCTGPRACRRHQGRTGQAVARG